VDLHPFKDVKICSLEVRFPGNGPQVVRVPDDNVRIGPNLDPALAGVDPECLGRIRTGDRHESCGVCLLAVHDLLPDDAEPVFDAVDAVRDLGEVALADRFGVCRVGFVV